MIITRTPFRVSLFGGGTDYPSYFQNSDRGGAVLGLALDKYCYVSVRKLPPFFSHRHRLVYSRIELVNSAKEISHPTVRAVLTELSSMIGADGLEIHHDGDLPARSGLGSSSSFVVGLLNALHALYASSVSSDDLRDTAIRVERDMAREVVGSQDQAFAAHGGFRKLCFYPDGTISSELVRPDPAWEAAFLDTLMLVFVGTTRFASQIAEAQVLRADANKHHLDEMRSMVDVVHRAILEGQSPLYVGALLHESWMIKRTLSSLVSNSYIDGLYSAARRAGAVGGKLLGAGGGGFLLLAVPAGSRETVRAAVRERMPVYVEVPVRIAWTGSEVVLSEPNGL